MKTYSLSIIDSEGEVILDRDIMADEVIKMLLDERYDVSMNVQVSGKDDKEKKSVDHVQNGKKGGRKPGTIYNCSKCGEPGHTVKTCKSGKIATVEIEQGPGSTLPEVVKGSVLKRFKAGMEENEIWGEVCDYMTHTQFKEAMEWAKLQ